MPWEGERHFTMRESGIMYKKKVIHNAMMQSGGDHNGEETYLRYN